MEPNVQNEEEKKEEESKVQERDKPEEERVEKEEEKGEEVGGKKEDKEEDNKEENEEENKEDNKEEKEAKDEEKDDKKEKKEKEKKEKKSKKVKKDSVEKKNLILSIDEENNKCIDCGKDNPTKVSINNGVIICEECAEKHEELGHSISFIKDIDDDFDEYLLNFIVFGSNSKFKRFLEQEKVDPSLPIEKKYLTKACFFYRTNLKRKINGENPLTEKNYEDPNEIQDNYENEYPEFNHYKIKSKVVHDGALKTKQNIKLNKLGGSILSFGKKMYGGIKTGANYVAKKAEGPTKSLKIGAGYVGKQVGHAYEVIKNAVPKGKKKEKEKDNAKEGEDMNKENPPNLGDNQNQNIPIESRRPLNDQDDVKEEKLDDGQKEVNQNIEQQGADNNEEKIDS